MEEQTGVMSVIYVAVDTAGQRDLRNTNVLSAAKKLTLNVHTVHIKRNRKLTLLPTLSESTGIS